MTNDELIELIAVALRTSDHCGLTLKGERVFCDDKRLGVAEDYHCSCKHGAQAALSVMQAELERRDKVIESLQRGFKFTGTENCKVVDCVQNIKPK